MLNILVVFFLALRLWGKDLKGRVVQVHWDNFAVVNVLSDGRGRDPYLLAVAHNICMFTARGDIRLETGQVLGKANSIADVLPLWFTNINREILNKQSLRCQWCSITPVHSINKTYIAYFNHFNVC